ncbi:YTH domain-containing family protein 2 [Aethina tumida]|uniref:YTH domain-containing family protein 2 n=1 Tax=Aethina tumida TaxID=116153 RepID=UPI00096B3797|nr:YTH domain-containing family protein 2 [Aethina tumida]
MVLCVRAPEFGFPAWVRRFGRDANALRARTVPVEAPLLDLSSLHESGVVFLVAVNGAPHHLYSVDWRDCDATPVIVVTVPIDRTEGALLRGARTQCRWTGADFVGGHTKDQSMSAGVSDQRMKGQGNQVSNGPKEQLGAGEGASGSEEFEPWRSAQQQQQQQQQNSAAHAYGASVPISTGTDLYNMNTAGYYGSGGTYPYQAYGVGDGTWSNGTDPMTFLGTYGHDTYSMDGMFGPSTTFSTATAFAAGQHSSFNYFHSNGGDYNTWGSQLGGQQQQRKYDDYYRGDPQNMYTQQMPDSLKNVEQAMQNLDMKSDGKESLGGGQQKKTTWASIASQPAKPTLNMQSQGVKKKGPGMPPGPIVPGKHNMDIGTWDTAKTAPPQAMPMVNSVAAPKNSGSGGVTVRPGWNVPPTGGRPLPSAPPQPPTHPGAGAVHAYQTRTLMAAPPPQAHMAPPPINVPPGSHIQSMMPPPPVQMMVAGAAQQHQQQAAAAAAAAPAPTHPVLDELRGKNNYNPTDFDLTAPNARFFVIKSYSEDDIHRSIKYEIWCSTEHGNKRLDQAYRERERDGVGGMGPVYLFFSVNGSGHFCGMAQMVSAVDYNANSSVWSQDKWKGQFKVRWIYVKDVPNVQLRHIRLENNDNKPVTNSRDTQEVPHPKGLQVLRIMHSYRHSTSIFDDFVHYEKRQEEEDNRKQPPPQQAPASNGRDHHHHHHHESGGSGGGGGGGGGRDHHKGAREHRDGDRDGHRSDRHHRSGGDHHGGSHHKDRGENGRGGRGGRGRN